MSRTHVERIVERHAVGFQAGRPPHTGDAVWLRPDRLMTHDNTSAVLARFRAMGGTRVARPENCVIALDHDVQNRTEANLAKYASIERFAREQGIEFHPPGSGIGHQIVVERGYARAGDLVVAADSHANMYGALGALGTAVARSDAAAIWAAGLFWWEVPPVVRVVLEGRLPAGSTGKDAALLLCALYPDDVLGAAVEFARRRERRALDGRPTHDGQPRHRMGRCRGPVRGRPRGARRLLRVDDPPEPGRGVPHGVRPRHARSRGPRLAELSGRRSP